MILKKFRKNIYRYCETLFRKQASKSEIETKQFLDNVAARILSNEQIKLCKKELIEEDLYEVLKSISNNKPPRNDGLTKELYEIFWDDLKELYVMSMRKILYKKE